MAKINIYIQDQLLEQVDADAEAFGRSRSSLVQEALADYLAMRRGLVSDAVARARADRAFEHIRQVLDAPYDDPFPDVSASDLVIESRRANDDPTVDELVRRIRERRSGELS